MQNLVDGRDGLIRRRMEDDDDGTDEAYRTAEFAQGSQKLVQEIGAEDGADQNREGA